MEKLRNERQSLRRELREVKAKCEEAEEEQRQVTLNLEKTRKENSFLKEELQQAKRKCMDADEGHRQAEIEVQREGLVFVKWSAKEEMAVLFYQMRCNKR